jgi:hypothetical protein
LPFIASEGTTVKAEWEPDELIETWTLTALARELKATERAVAERVRYQLRGSYSHYYRRMLAPLLAALEFRCNNSAYRPVMDAIGLLARYAGTDSDRRPDRPGRPAARRWSRPRPG